MTKKLMLGIFLALFLLLANLTFAGETSSPAPAITKVASIPSDCDCLKKDKAPPSPGLSANDIVEEPNQVPQRPGGCHYRCIWIKVGGVWTYLCEERCGFLK